MLTGDKAETAISVAQACALVPPCAEIERLLNITDPKELRFVLIRADADFELLTLHSDRLDDLQAMSTADSGDERYTQRYVLVDGESCITAQDHNELSDKFVSIMRHASVVIAARVSPLQKASFVRMIKHLQDAPVTLAIGDGANDVSMLHEAQIGVGICGREGRHAANNSDFAVAQFRYVLAVHSVRS
jgi:phospholipid-transporting ATPase